MGMVVVVVVVVERPIPGHAGVVSLRKARVVSLRKARVVSLRKARRTIKGAGPCIVSR